MIVSAALHDFNGLPVDSVDNPIEVVNPAAPVTGKIAFQWLGFAKTFIAAVLDVFQEGVRFFEELFVLL